MKFGEKPEELAKSLVVPHEGTWIEIPMVVKALKMNNVVPHEGTWIEMVKQWKNFRWRQVVPHEGTWIEIAAAGDTSATWQSFPTRERGLK